jgi:hypothetical protein
MISLVLLRIAIAGRIACNILVEKNTKTYRFPAGVASRRYCPRMTKRERFVPPPGVE